MSVLDVRYAKLVVPPETDLDQQERQPEVHQTTNSSPQVKLEKR
jgi:hypothetical protein